jgi:hypothetical protein
MLIESSFVSLFDPLLFEFVRCALSAIDGVRDRLCSRSSSIGSRSRSLFEASVPTTPHVLLKSTGVPLFSVHVISFFLSSFRYLCFEVLKLVLPVLFFLFLLGSAVKT